MTTDPTDDPTMRFGPPVRAAGGVVLANHAEHGQVVLVVHRPAHADWSLPKGHIDAGETATETALREVREETGVDARIVAELGMTEHHVRTPHARLKQVEWFRMRPSTPDPARAPDAVALMRPADDEVDVVAWWPTRRALTGLTYAGERALLRRALADDRDGGR